MSVKVDVLVNDKAVTTYNHKGKTYIEGRVGSEFKLRLKNNTYGRVLVIPSVDGLSIIDGKPASDKSQGYVLSSQQELIVPGWLKSNQEAAKFVFEDSGVSYSAKKGEGTTNCGVVGVMVFNEKIVYNSIYYNSLSPFYDNFGNYPTGVRGMASMNSIGGNVTATAMSASLSSKEPVEKVGTGMGENTSFATTKVDFKRQDTPLEIVSLFYDTRKNLEKLGIKFREEPKEPNPFPNYSSGFCESV